MSTVTTETNLDRQAKWEEKVPKSLKGAKVCPVCGKKIYSLYWGDYVYKIHSKAITGSSEPQYYCGWNCMRKVQKPYEDKIKAKLMREAEAYAARHQHKKDGSGTRGLGKHKETPNEVHKV